MPRVGVDGPLLWRSNNRGGRREVHSEAAVVAAISRGRQQAASNKRTKIQRKFTVSCYGRRACREQSPRHRSAFDEA